MFNNFLSFYMTNMIYILHVISIVDIMSRNDNPAIINLRSIIEKNKLNGNNFLDWERNLRIVLRSEGRENVLDTPSQN